MRPILMALPILSWSTVAAADVAPADVVGEVERALAHADPMTPIGSAIGAGPITASTDVPADVRAIREDFRAKGYEVLRADETTLTVEVGRARATIALGERGGTISITPKPSATVAPGKCVAIPDVVHTVDLNSRATGNDGEHHEGTSHWKLSTIRAIDVDGDGIPDAFVPQPGTRSDCPETVMWRVYVTRGTCGHDLGLVGPSFPTVDASPLDASGFRPLVAASVTTKRGQRGIPDHITTTNRFAVTKGKYAQVDTVQRIGICHHCATWHCSAVP